mgnify:FL=1
MKGKAYSCVDLFFAVGLLMGHRIYVSRITILIILNEY